MLHVHPHSVQRPTHPNLHVRDMHDAHIVLEAVRLHKLQPVTRRLNEVERMSFIRSGSVFVWEESDDDTGLRRWTDGLLWSASRMREPFLFYETRTVIPRYPPMNHPGLVKQTYSALVSLPSTSGTPNVRKWHLTAYLEQSNLADLLTVDTDPILCDIQLPPGMYRSGKSRQRQNNSDGAGGLRWINIDGNSGQALPRRTASSSPEASVTSSPSQSPTISNSPNVMTSPSMSPTLTQPYPRRPLPPSMASSSRPSVPEAYLGSSPQATLLPPFQAAFVFPQSTPSPPPTSTRMRTSSRKTMNTSDPRSAEDARVIDLLNARSSLA